MNRGRRVGRRCETVTLSHPCSPVANSTRGRKGRLGKATQREEVDGTCTDVVVWSILYAESQEDATHYNIDGKGLVVSGCVLQRAGGDRVRR